MSVGATSQKRRRAEGLQRGLEREVGIAKTGLTPSKPSRTAVAADAARATGMIDRDRNSKSNSSTASGAADRLGAAIANFARRPPSRANVLPRGSAMP